MISDIFCERTLDCLVVQAALIKKTKIYKQKRIKCPFKPIRIVLFSIVVLEHRGLFF